jgi:hypothetical protein
VADLLDTIRAEALHKRVHGAAGGHRIAWSEKDLHRIHDHIARLPRTLLAAPAHAPAPITRRLDVGVPVNKEMTSADRRFLFTISSADIDHSGDSIDPNGFDLGGFRQNPCVLSSHDSEAAPIATSTVPWVASGKLMAIAEFPSRGVSAASDAVGDAVRAGLLRGASVGFIPVKWAFSKDPARPMGIDFSQVRLLEWSVCSIPCNPAALIVGAVSGKSASGLADLAERRREEERMDRVAEARKLARMART